jgi:hypothetical protein
LSCSTYVTWVDSSRRKLKSNSHYELQRRKNEQASLWGM